ncbi:MAG: ATP-binding protein [Myxococcota bacterium]|nr:ATP-binding protein [Myxococcota bacterium]
MSAWRSRPAWAPLAVGAVVSGVLLASTWFIHLSVRDASELTARGLGEVFVLSGWQNLGGIHFPPSQEDLRIFLASHEQDGLRFVAVYSDSNTELVSAGEAHGQGMSEGLTLNGDRARLVGRIRARRPPFGRRLLGEDRGDRPRTPPRIVYEFEPLAALELQRRSRDLFFVSALSCLGVMGLAFALSRTLGQREKMREELEHGRRLAALGSMSAVLAHELRNPLASLKGHAQLLAETVEGDQRLHPRADRVVSEAVRLERLMNDLLLFVKSGALRRAPVDPAAILRAAVETTDPTRIDLQLPATVQTARLDPERLRQALENVLQNALQASPPGGRVTAQLRWEGGEVIFSIRDTGPGITAGEEARIFEPFVTHKIKGIGLGLAITRRIVEQHGGQILARNRETGGAEFELRLPSREQ